MNDSSGTSSRHGAGVNPAFALALICAAQFVLTLDFSIVNVALPSIQRELGMAAAQLQWIVTGYALTFGSLLLAGGRAADLFGRRRLLTAGLVLFALASLLSGLAPSPLVLIVARIIQGAGGAMVSPAALSLLTTAYGEGPERNRALGIWQAVTASGATAGIIAGGLLTQYLGWRAIFLVNPPLIAVLLLLVSRLLPASAPVRGARLDIGGAALSTAALAALIFAVSNGQQQGFGSARTLAALAAVVLLAVAFVVAERRAAAPMLPFAILAARTRRASLIAVLLAGAALAGYVYFTSLYLQRVEGYSPLRTGLALLPATVTVAALSTFSRRVLGRLGVKRTLAAGLILVAAGQLWLVQIAAGAGYAAAVLPGLLLTSLGIGLAFPAAAVGVMSGVESDAQGLAGALLTTGQQSGAAVGLAALAALAALLTEQTAGSLVAGYRLAFVAGAGVALVAAAVVAFGLSADACQAELARQEEVTGSAGPHLVSEAQLSRR